MVFTAVLDMKFIENIEDVYFEILNISGVTVGVGQSCDVRLRLSIAPKDGKPH